MKAALCTALYLLATFSIASTCYTIQAAFNLGSDFYATNGSDYVSIEGGIVSNFTPISDLGLSFEPDAALSCDRCDENKPALFFDGEDVYRYTKGNPLRGPFRASDIHHFLKHGVDAAAKKNGHTYFFKGCKYLQMSFLDFSPPIAKKFFNFVDLLNNVLGKPKIGHLPHVGLPCDIDSAWEDGPDMVITKEEESYMWTADGYHAVQHDIPEYGLPFAFCAVSKGKTTTAAPTELPTTTHSIPYTEPSTKITTKPPTEPLTFEPITATPPPTEAPTSSKTHTTFITEVITQPASEAPTQPPTESPIQPPSEAPTESSTEAPMQPPTEEPTQSSTEAPTQPSTQAPTQSSTEYFTETSTSFSTESSTQPSTEPAA